MCANNLLSGFLKGHRTGFCVLFRCLGRSLESDGAQHPVCHIGDLQ